MPLPGLIDQQPEELIKNPKLVPDTSPALEEPTSLSPLQVNPPMQSPLHSQPERQPRVGVITERDKMPAVVHLSLKTSRQREHDVSSVCMDLCFIPEH